jgi:Ca2+-binding RTX toxin-like protein
LTINGTTNADVLNGGAGNDYLYGYNWLYGNDTYIFEPGSGHDTISDYDSTIGNVDTIQLKYGITPLRPSIIYGNITHKLRAYIG